MRKAIGPIVLALGAAAALLLGVRRGARAPVPPTAPAAERPPAEATTLHGAGQSATPARESQPAAAPAAVMRPAAGRTRGQPRPAAGATRARTTDAIPNEFVLSFFDERDKDAFIKRAQARGVEILGSLELAHAVRIRVPGREVLDDLLRDGPAPVNWSENFYVRAPNPTPWGRNRREAGSGYVGFGPFALPWLGVPADRDGWGAGVTVAVLDSGIGTHPSLQNVAVQRLNVLDDGLPADQAWGVHGTAVASLIAGRSAEVGGIAPAAALLSVRVLAEDGRGDTFTLARGIVLAVDHGASVINVSLGTGGDSLVVREAIEYARQRGAVIVAAVGNDGVEGVEYPARYDGVVAVTGVDAGGRHLFFANRGPEVAIAAPAAGVFAAGTNLQTAAFSGTSAGAPLVSGALAALLSQNEGMAANEAVATLTRYCDDAGPPGPDEDFGAGILNVARVQNRATRGLYDAAVGGLYLRPGASTNEDPVALILVENRGTENLYCVRLEVALDGVRSRQSFYNLSVGQARSYEFRVSLARLRQGDISLAYGVAIEGAADADRRNDSREVEISLRDVVVEAP